MLDVQVHYLNTSNIVFFFLFVLRLFYLVKKNIFLDNQLYKLIKSGIYLNSIWYFTIKTN